MVTSDEDLFRQCNIQNAEQMYTFCEANVTIGAGSSDKCIHKTRVFFYQERVERKEQENELKTLKGTRSFHSVRGVEPGIVQARELSCSCTASVQGGEEAVCVNQKYVGEWTLHAISKSKSECKVNWSQTKCEQICCYKKKVKDGVCPTCSGTDVVPSVRAIIEVTCAQNTCVTLFQADLSLLFGTCDMTDALEIMVCWVGHLPLAFTGVYKNSKMLNIRKQ